jgi:hypothetical protein
LSITNHWLAGRKKSTCQPFSGEIAWEMVGTLELVDIGAILWPPKRAVARFQKMSGGDSARTEMAPRKER